jgi:hypothetical protein
MKSKLIQICASQNDLFGLDDGGKVYRYNFSTSIWVHLGRRRTVRTQSPSTHGVPSIAGEPRVASDRSPSSA